MGEEDDRAFGHLDRHTVIAAFTVSRMARILWLPGTIQVGPEATVQSSSAQTPTPVMANSGNGSGTWA